MDSEQLPYTSLWKYCNQSNRCITDRTTVAYVLWVTRDDEVVIEDALADAGGDGTKQPTVFELFHKHAEAVEVTVDHMLTAVDKATR